MDLYLQWKMNETLTLDTKVGELFTLTTEGVVEEVLITTFLCWKGAFEWYSDYLYINDISECNTFYVNWSLCFLLLMFTNYECSTNIVYILIRTNKECGYRDLYYHACIWLHIIITFIGIVLSRLQNLEFKYNESTDVEHMSVIGSSL